jgi:hypothetical protein
VLTNDPLITLGGKHLEPPGLPGSTSEWSYVDVARARPALVALGLLARNTSWVARFDLRFAGLSSYLTYTTHDRGEQTTTVVLH